MSHPSMSRVVGRGVRWAAKRGGHAKAAEGGATHPRHQEIADTLRAGFFFGEGGEEERERGSERRTHQTNANKENADQPKMEQLGANLAPANCPKPARTGHNRMDKRMRWRC